MVVPFCRCALPPRAAYPAYEAAVVIGEVGLDHATVDIGTWRPQDSLDEPAARPGRNTQAGQCTRWV